MMVSPAFRVLAIFVVCLMASVGCNRSDTAALAQAKTEAQSAKAEAQAAKAELAKAKDRADVAEAELAKLKAPQSQPKLVDADRRAAEWVLRVEGSVRVLADGASLDVKKDGKLPDGQWKLVSINLIGCAKATDDGLDYIRGLKDLREFLIHYDTPIRKFDFLADMVNLEVLGLASNYGGVSDEDLTHIKGLTKLKILNVSAFFGDPKVTDAALLVVKDLKQLETLIISGRNITDAGLQHLKGHGALRSLHLQKTKITDAGMETLKSLPKLEDLRVTEGEVTDAGVKSLKAALPKCQVMLIK